ncbi:MAG: SCO family protein [Reyranellaceae bacterium]
MSRITKIVLVVWALALIGAGAWIAQDALLKPEPTMSSEQRGFFTTESAASIGGPFQLTDQNGRKRSSAEFRGKTMLIYFGFTYCPDVCPTALTVMTTALDQLGEQADAVVPILITVDPERDTVAVLKDYVAQFSPRIVGFTGSEREIAEVAKLFRVYYAKSPGSGGAPYLMDHTSLVYLMDQNGRFATHFTHNSRAEDMVAAVRKLLANPPKQAVSN